MNRFVLCGVAVFFAIVGIALVGGEEKASAGLFRHGCGGCGGYDCGGHGGYDCGAAACCGRKHRNRCHGRCGGLFSRKRCGGHNDCCGPVNNCCGEAPACCPAPAPSCCGEAHYAPSCGGEVAPPVPGNGGDVPPPPPVDDEKNA